MATRLYVNFVSTDAMIAAFDADAAKLATLKAACKAFSAASSAGMDGQAEWDAMNDAANAAGPIAWFTDGGDGFGRITAAPFTYALEAGVCGPEDYCGGSKNRAVMRELAVLQASYALSYDNDEYERHTGAIDRVLDAIDAGVVAEVYFV